MAEYDIPTTDVKDIKKEAPKQDKVYKSCNCNSCVDPECPIHNP